MKRSLRSWLWSVPLDQEVDDELRLHMDLRARELVERGIDPGVAREMAAARLGDVRQLKRTCIALGRKREREMRLTQWLQEFGADVRFAIRQLRRAPAFTFVAAITLALGIGVNSAIFALADATLIRPLPFSDPDRLVMVWERMAAFSRGAASPLNFRDWNERNRTFESMASVITSGRRMTGSDGNVETVPGQLVSVRFFDVLGITPLAGRTFQPADAIPAPNVVVIGESFWRTRYGGDPSIVGRAIQLDDQPFTVIGVVPARFQFNSEANLWTLTSSFPGLDGRGLHFLSVIGRLKPGVTREAASSDMNAIADALAVEYPATNRGRGINLEPLREWLIGPEVRTTALVLFGVVGFVLLMCCANVANLLLARTTGRARELAVRSALGAGRRRILAQIMTESLVLATLGGLLGLGAGAAILSVAPSMIPAGLLPRSLTLSFDGRVVAFCAASTLLVGFLFGLIPAWQATGTSLTHVMGSSSRGGTRGGRLRSLVVATEVAAAVLLLCGAGLLLRTLLALQDVDAGFGTANVLTMRVSLPHGIPGARYPTQDALRRFFDDVERDVRTIPGVRNVGWVSSLPLDGTTVGGMSFEIVGGPPVDAGNRPLADYQVVSPTYFDTVEIPLVLGRAFSATDETGGAQVCIVDETFVRRHFKDQNPIGSRIAIRPITPLPAGPVAREIVGVVRDVKSRPNETDGTGRVYVPQTQNAWMMAAIAVRPVDGPAARLSTAVRAAIARVDPQLPVTRIRTLEDVAWEATSRFRFRAVLVGGFATLALLLAMVGVFGVLAYTVQQRTREFGVRIALGARMRDVMRIVLGSAAKTTVAGAAVGLAGAGLLSRSLATLLFDVPPLDPIAFGAALLVLLVTAVFATLIPALRAARVDPIVAVRND
jgi:putative ABC transport system permease protein